jgi:acetolactate synthase-1/2/3 large subunit
LDRSPLIAFTDEMPDHLLKRTVQMYINHQQLFFPITKWTTRLNTQNVEEIILKGNGIATSETPGSVHIGIPAGIGHYLVNETGSTVDFLRLEKKKWSSLVSEKTEKINEFWSKSEKPLLVVGLSAIRANVKDLIIKVAEKFQIPVVLTPMAKGMFPEEHPLYTGVLFHALSNLVAETYREADLVIGIGYDPVEFNYEEWMPEVPLIHCDTKEADIDEIQFPLVLNCIGELKTSLEEFLQIKSSTKKWEVKVLQKRKERLFQKLIPKPNSFGPLAVVHILREVLPEKGILTVDVGAHLHLIGQQWRTPNPHKLLMTNGWSSMGFAIPAALAAKLCNPEIPVAALMGDGGFYMMVGELATAKRLNLKIVFIVIYDNSLSLIRIKQDNKRYDSLYGTQLNSLTEKPTNHYFGVPVIRATDSESYQKALAKAFAAEGPMLIEAVVDGSDYDELVLKPGR